MNSTYTEHAAICAKFYELTADASHAGEFVLRGSGAQAGDKVLFVGGMFHLARYLADAGLDITVVDYSDEMVALGRERLPGVRVERADLRSLGFERQFDVVLVVGRVFTHMISDDDLRKALASCRLALRDSGRLFFDSYESSKIRLTPYFNGSICVGAGDTEIKRESTTELASSSPFVVRWSARYSGVHEGRNFSFSDAMDHRAWARPEIAAFLRVESFEMIRQGDNFDSTSFFTLARAV